MSFDDKQSFASHSGGGTSYRIVADWRQQGACGQEDPELFFPVGNTGPALLQIEEAKAVCRRCPVMETCGDWAMDTGQDSGVWGGLSEDERRAIKRRVARQRTAASKQKSGAQR
jgi:WhiB family redox-sensing transcriptional regulator